jgi:hypothetical protein
MSIRGSDPNRHVAPKEEEEEEEEDYDDDDDDDDDDCRKLWFQ